MSVFASQFARAQSYTTAYVGEDTDSRFWTPNTVTAVALAGAGALVVAAAVDGATDGAGAASLGDDTLALPGTLIEPQLPGAVAVDDAAGGDMLDAFPGLHTSSAVGGVDVTADDAAQLGDGGSSAWSHYFEAGDTHVGGDGGDFSYVMTDSGTVYMDGGDVSFAGF